MATKKVEYEELSSAKINEQKMFVLSRYKKGGFTLAQKIVVKEENSGKKFDMFLKNPYQIDDIIGLTNLRDALNIAITKIENNEKV